MRISTRLRAKSGLRSASIDHRPPASKSEIAPLLSFFAIGAGLTAVFAFLGLGVGIDRPGMLVCCGCRSGERIADFSVTEPLGASGDTGKLVSSWCNSGVGAADSGLAVASRSGSGVSGMGSESPGSSEVVDIEGAGTDSDAPGGFLSAAIAWVSSGFPERALEIA
jgi:hypothetical protein